MNDKELYEGFKKIIEVDLSKIVVQYTIDSYNKFVLEGVQRIIDSIEFIPLEENLRLYLSKIEFGEPVLKEADGYERKITPIEAMIRDLEYSCPLYVNVIPVENNVHQEKIKIKLCEFPIMIKSVLDPTSTLDKDGLIDIGQDPYDPGGYFLINGTEKIIVGVEEVANNRAVITKEKKKGIEMARINSERDKYIQRHMIERKNHIL